MSRCCGFVVQLVIQQIHNKSYKWGLKSFMCSSEENCGSVADNDHRTHSLSETIVDQSRHPAGIKFTHRPKIRFFCPTGATRYTDLIQTWQDQWAPGSAWLCKISPQSVQGHGNAPCRKNIKNFHFLVMSRLAEANANPLTDF